MLKLFLSFFLAATAAAYQRGEIRTCSGACQTEWTGGLMTKSMMAKQKAHDECFLSGECPLKVQSVSGKIPCVNGKAGVYSCLDTDLLSHVNITNLGGARNGNDIWGWTDPETNKEYALVALTDGSSFVDVTNPEHPIVLVFVPGTSYPTGAIWRDIKVYKNHAFIGSEVKDHGIQVFDLTRLRGLSGPRQSMQPDVVYTGVGSSHNVVINEASGFLYSVGSKTCAGGLHIVDILDPKNPSFVACFDSDGYTHDAICFMYSGPDARFTGREICIAYNEDSVTIVDVEDKDHLVMLARVEYVGVAYCHQGWVTEDQAFMLHDDELDELEGLNDGHTETYIWNISRLDAPVNTGSYYSPVTSIDHNQYILGSRAYQANYESGLRIVDISKIADAQLRELGNFDVRPENTTVAFWGAWSVYPYFPARTWSSTASREVFLWSATKATIKHLACLLYLV